MISKNQFGEPIEFISGLVLNLDYWDCECDDNYIHPVNEKTCQICRSSSETQPNSRESEVLAFIKHSF